MSHAPRYTTLPSHLRPSSGLSASANTQSSQLQARISEKKVELDNLAQLRDLSAGLAGQMQQLEEKLATLSSGTEAVAAVLGNWNSVLRAIHMASTAIPKPQDIEGEQQPEPEMPLPQTLVRIPIQQAEKAQKDQDAATATDAAGD